MTRVELTELARQDLDFLIRTRELPATTYDRVEEMLDQLRGFPLTGQTVDGRYPGARCTVVAWGWLGLLYHYLESDDVVLVVAFYDGRTRGAPHP